MAVRARYTVKIRNTGLPWWWGGRLVGLAAGGAVFGWGGAAAGLVAGALLDRWLRLRWFSPRCWRRSSRSHTERLFFLATFSVAGQMAKADGRVSEREIDMARLLMAELNLTADEQRCAAATFTRGKRPGFPLVAVVSRLRRAARGRAEMLDRFVDYQLRMALVDGGTGPRQMHVLQAVGASLRLPAEEMERRIRRRRAQPPSAAKALLPRLQEAYATLEVKESASAGEIKQAYRRMISRHHPDRLEGQGVSEQELQRAAAKTHEIHRAFNEIRRTRGF